MKLFGRNSLWIPAVLALAVLALATPTAASASSNHQVILSGTGIATTAGPAGFWIWSQPGGTNSYGNNGAGSIYFYVLLPGEHPVDVSSVVVSGNTVSEVVKSTDGLITCPSFTGTETSPGTGFVSFTCFVSTPGGSVTAVATKVPAQVNISSNP